MAYRPPADSRFDEARAAARVDAAAIPATALDDIDWDCRGADDAHKLGSGWATEQRLHVDVLRVKQLSRPSLQAIVDGLTLRGDWTGAMLHIGAWGSGRSRDFDHRKIVPAADAGVFAERAGQAARLDVECGPLVAFHYLRSPSGRVPGWNPGPQSAFLHFASTDAGALIFDAAVTEALCHLVPDERHPATGNSPEGYAYHVEMVRQIAKRVGVASASAEAALQSHFKPLLTTLRETRKQAFRRRRRPFAEQAKDVMPGDRITYETWTGYEDDGGSDLSLRSRGVVVEESVGRLRVREDDGETRLLRLDEIIGLVEPDDAAREQARANFRTRRLERDRETGERRAFEESVRELEYGSADRWLSELGLRLSKRHAVVSSGSRASFIGAGSGLPVQGIPKRPGMHYAALVAGDWVPEGVAYLIASRMHAYLFLARETADVVTRTELSTVAAARPSGPGGVNVRPLVFALEGTRAGQIADTKPEPMPDHAWQQVQEQLLDADKRRSEEVSDLRKVLQPARDAVLLAAYERLIREWPAPDPRPSPHFLRASISATSGIRYVLVKDDTGRTVARLIANTGVLLMEHDEALRSAAADKLREGGYEPLRPLAGFDPPQTTVSLTYLPRRDVYDIWIPAYATTDGRDSAAANVVIARFFPATCEVVCVSDVWEDEVIRLLARAGLRATPLRESVPGDYGHRLVERLAWDRRVPEIVSSSFVAPDAAAPPRTVTSAVLGALPAVIGEALAEVFQASGPVYRARLTDSLTSEHAARLLAVAPVVTLPAAATAAVTAAFARFPHQAPCYPAAELRAAEPEWWAALPWQARELRSGHGDDLQARLLEMTPAQVATASHPDLVGLVTNLSNWPRPRWPGDFTQADEARAWITIAALYRDKLLDPSVTIEDTNTCPICGDAFDPCELWPSLAEHLGATVACPHCSRAAIYGADTTWTEAREAALPAVLALVADRTGRLPTRALFRHPLPVPPEHEVEALVCRMLVPHALDQRGSTMTRALQSAGLLGDHARRSRGIETTANDGHRCRSLFEREIDDYLSAAGIPHEPEPPYPYDPERNRNGLLRADWELPDRVFVEAAGMMSDPAYAARIANKQQLAATLGIQLIVIEPKDLPNLSTLLN